MKTIYKISLAAFAFFLVSMGVLFAFNGAKSPKLPWQGTPAWFLDATHNVGTASAGQTRFTAPGGWVVLDSVTGLMWQSASSSSSMTWSAASSYCSPLTTGWYSGWRLPTIKELNSIVDFSRSNPSIDTAYFTTVSSYYWASTPYTAYAGPGWVVDFAIGYVYTAAKTSPLLVRCVR